jgi:hypothetical protein
MTTIFVFDNYDCDFIDASSLERSSECKARAADDAAERVASKTASCMVPPATT